MKKLVLSISFLLFSILSFGQVVISEVYGGGGNAGSVYKNDFIELYNAGSSPVSLAGWSVQYASAAGTTWAVTNLSGTIPARGFYLVQEALGAGGTTNLPNPDAIGTIAMSGTAGKVILCNVVTAQTGASPTGAAIVDKFAFGASTAIEGNPTAVLSNTTDAERKANSTSTASSLAAGGTDETAGNGYDTNDNSNDFVIQALNAINPQNTSSATEPAGPSSSPTLVVAPSSLTFNQAINTVSTAQTYTLSGANLTAGITVTTSAPYTISKDGSTYSTSISYTTAELATVQTVRVRFSPTTAGSFSGSILHSSTGAATQTLLLTATAFDPNNLTFNFNTCNGTTLADGWTQFSVLGAQTWACTAFGRDPANPSNSLANGVQMNGFASGSNVLNEDWLISPVFNTSSFTYPLFSFWSRTAFNGGPLKLRVSTNYSGSGNPSAATWTDIIVSLPNQASDIWTQTRNIDLSAFKGTGVYVAFVYTSTNDDGARWTLDDVNLVNSATPPPPSVFSNPTGLSFGYLTENTNATRTLSISSSNLTGAVTLVSSSPAFQLSKDGLVFASSITFTTAEANGLSKQATVRFVPTTPFTNYSGAITVSSPNTTDFSISLSGNTYNTANTLEVVNWNIEWFGSVEPGLGPTNKNQQEANIKTILSNLNADIYGLLEVVSETRLQNVVSQMPGYTYKVSDFGSYADNAADPDYAGAQKLAFVYKTSVFSNVTVSSFFRCTQLQNCPEFNYWSSGRFPYVMEADVTLNGVTKRMTFVLIHAKANTSPTQTSYDRRKNGAIALKAKLDADYANSNFIVLGDFNDDLDQTITAGITPPVTSYSSFNADPANYIPLTLPLSQAGKKSTVSYNDVIDHVVVSNEMNVFYVNNSAEILNSVAGLVASYGSTTTDHYPVLTRYAFGNVPPTLNAVSAAPVCFTTVPQSLALSGITTGQETGQIITLSISTNNPGMFSSLTISNGTSGNGTVNYTLSPSGAIGTANITVTVKDNGGTSNGGSDTFSRTFNLIINPVPVIDIASDKGTDISKGDIVALTATGGNSYTWTGPNILGASNSAVVRVRPSASGTYQVTATNASGCSAVQNITLNVVPDYRSINVTNVLTPNGDGKNDTWVVRNIDLYPSNEVFIYDKAGRIVYSKKNYNNDWAGTYQGTALNEDTYFYVISFGPSNGTFKGSVTLLRDK